MLTVEAIAVIVKLMAPYVGDTMAGSAAAAHCQKLGIATDGPITQEQIDALLGRLGSGLNIFLGREKSGAVVEQMRASLRAAGEKQG